MIDKNFTASVHEHSDHASFPMLQRLNDFLALLLKNYIFIMAMGLHHFDPPIKKLSRLSNIYLTEYFLWNQTYIFCGAENVARSRIASTVLSLLMLVYNTRNRPTFTGIETACMPVRGSCIESACSMWTLRC